MEEFKPYNLEQAQEEAEKLRQKVKSKEVSDYHEAEELFELEEKEEKEKPEVIAWAKRVVKQWHDEIKPDYLFFTETGAIPFAYVLKSTWKRAYPNQALPRFYRLEPDGPFSKESLQKYLSKIIKGDNPAIIVFDEGAHSRIGTELVVEDKDYRNRYIKAEKFFLRGTLENAASTIYYGMKDMLGHTPRVYASKDSQYSSIFEKLITNKQQKDLTFPGGQGVSRSPTSRTLGQRSNRTQIKSEDEMLITSEYLKNLVENGEIFRGRIVKHPAQRKRALAWVKRLRDIGQEAGEELKKEIEASKEERALRIRDANSWIERVGNKVENQKLAENNIEVFSDEQLQTEDIEFIIATKTKLDTGEGKPVRIIILNKEHWSEFMGLLGRDGSHKQFVGRAEENPITPTDINQFLVLPSSEVFSQDTPYKQMYLSSPKVQEMINQPEGVETLYRGIYLRNVLSHEMAHLYQFSSAEVQDILQSDDTGYHEKLNKFLETREFLSCLFGLFNLKKNDRPVYEAYIDACQQFVESGTGNAYAIEQAKRSLDSVNLLNSFSEQNIDEMFKKFHGICQSNNDLQKDDLQKMILLIRNGEASPSQLKEFVVKE